MLRSAQPSQFSTYPSQYIDTPVLAVLLYLCRMRVLKKINKFRSENGDLQPVNVSKELDQNAQEWADKIVINDHFKDRFI